MKVILSMVYLICVDFSIDETIYKKKAELQLHKLHNRYFSKNNN